MAQERFHIKYVPHRALNDNTDRYFPGQQKNEDIILFSRKHPIVLLPHTVIFILSLIAFPVVVYAIKAMTVEFGTVLGQALFIFFFAAYTFYFHHFFNRVLNFYLDVVILTNYRVIQLKKTVFFCNNKDTIDLYKIQDLKKDQFGFFCTLFDYGSIVIEVSAIHETKCVHYIPNPEKWFQMLNFAKRNYIEKRRDKIKLKAKEELSEVDIESQRHKLHGKVASTL